MVSPSATRILESVDVIIILWESLVHSFRLLIRPAADFFFPCTNNSLSSWMFSPD
uniref:Uncharacterized protein n=1 Tax=Arundo donax TaxID=35708 RepID=A0A0A9AZF2_ARUDO